MYKGIKERIWVGEVEGYEDYAAIIKLYGGHPADYLVLGCPYVGYWGLNYIDEWMDD